MFEWIIITWQYQVTIQHISCPISWVKRYTLIVFKHMPSMLYWNIDLEGYYLTSGHVKT